MCGKQREYLLDQLDGVPAELAVSDEGSELWGMWGWQKAALNEWAARHTESARVEAFLTGKKYPLLSSCPADAWSGTLAWGGSSCVRQWAELPPLVKTAGNSWHGPLGQCGRVLPFLKLHADSVRPRQRSGYACCQFWICLCEKLLTAFCKEVKILNWISLSVWFFFFFFIQPQNHNLPKINMHPFCHLEPWHPLWCVTADTVIS